MTSTDNTQAAGLDAERSKARDTAHRAYYNARWSDGATPEQAAALPTVFDALTTVYAPCDPDAPLDSRPFHNHLRRTIHLARWATDRNGIKLQWVDAWQPDRLNDVQRRFLSTRRQPAGTRSSTAATSGSSGVTPTGNAPDSDLWTAATLNVPEIAQAANRRLGKDSASEHDMSLAVRLRQLDWTPQQIADALWWNRQRRGEDMKYPDYYTRTADRAVQFVTDRTADRS